MAGSIMKFLVPKTDLLPDSPLSAVEQDLAASAARAALKGKKPQGDWGAAKDRKAAYDFLLLYQSLAAGVRGWNKTYKKQLTESTARRLVKEFTPLNPKTALKRKQTDDPTTTPQPPAKRGRPAFLGTEERTKLLGHIDALRNNAGVVTCNVIAGLAGSVVKGERDGTGAFIPHFTREWAKKFSRREGMVWRRGTTMTRTIKYTKELDGVGAAFRAKFRGMLAGVPPQLVVNCDHTSLLLVPSGSYTLEKKGAKEVPIISGDKRAYTLVGGVTLEGKWLPWQVITTGMREFTKPSLPEGGEDDFVVTQGGTSRWATEETTLALIEKIIRPHRENVIKDLNLDPNTRGVLLLDQFRAQMTKDVRKAIHEAGYELAYVPAGLTSSLQPLDCGPFGAFKNALTSIFDGWYTNQLLSIQKKLDKKFKKKVSKASKKGLPPPVRQPEALHVNMGTRVLRGLILGWCMKARKKISQELGVKCWETALNAPIKELLAPPVIAGPGFEKELEELEALFADFLDPEEGQDSDAEEAADQPAPTTETPASEGGTEKESTAEDPALWLSLDDGVAMAVLPSGRPAWNCGEPGLSES